MFVIFLATILATIPPYEAWFWYFLQLLTSFCSTETASQPRTSTIRGRASKCWRQHVTTVTQAYSLKLGTAITPIKIKQYCSATRGHGKPTSEYKTITLIGAATNCATFSTTVKLSTAATISLRHRINKTLSERGPLSTLFDRSHQAWSWQQRSSSTASELIAMWGEERARQPSSWSTSALMQGLLRK